MGFMDGEDLIGLHRMGGGSKETSYGVFCISLG